MNLCSHRKRQKVKKGYLSIIGQFNIGHKKKQPVKGHLISKHSSESCSWWKIFGFPTKTFQLQIWWDLKTKAPNPKNQNQITYLRFRTFRSMKSLPFQNLSPRIFIVCVVDLHKAKWLVSNAFRCTPTLMMWSMSLAEMSSGPHCQPIERGLQVSSSHDVMMSEPFLFMAFQNICWLG